MEIKVDRKELERELTIAKKIIGGRTNLAICQSVLLTLYDGGVAIQSTNLSRAYVGIVGDPLHSYWIPDNADKIAIDLTRLMKVVKAIPKKQATVPFEITWDGDGILVNNTTTIVSAGRAKDYPTLPHFPQSRSYNLLSYDALNQTNAIGGCKDDRRCHINHLYADTENGRLASTDGSRLYTMAIPIEPTLKPFMIEKDAASILCTPQLRDHIGKVRVSKDNLFVDTGNGYLSVSIPIDAEFPDIGMLIEYFNQDPDAIISMPDKQTMVDALNEAGGILGDGYKGIILEANGTVAITATNPDAGEFSKDITADVTKCGIDFEMAYNPKFIIDICKQIADTGINFLFPGQDQPLLVKSEINGFQAVIMPMNI